MTTGRIDHEPPAEELRREFAALALESLTIKFGGLSALEDVNMTVYDMDIVGLIGPNGAGKTTAFNIISGVYRPTSGRVSVKGRDITAKRPHEITRLGIARTFQNIRLFKKMTVLDNVRVAYHHHNRAGLVSSLLRTKIFRSQERDITEKAMQFLELFSLDARSRDEAGSLPYGQQRRLEIARALATEPRLLLLDEPAAGMNNTETEKLMELISWVRDQFHLTVLLIEHDMRFVMGVCKSITVLDHGRVIASGTPDEVRSNPGVIEAYLGQPQ